MKKKIEKGLDEEIPVQTVLDAKLGKRAINRQVLTSTIQQSPGILGDFLVLTRKRAYTELEFNQDSQQSPENCV